MFFKFGRVCIFFFFSSRRRHTRSYGDWSSDVCSSDLCYQAPLSKAYTSKAPVIFHQRLSKLLQVPEMWCNELPERYIFLQGRFKQQSPRERKRDRSGD